MISNDIHGRMMGCITNCSLSKQGNDLGWQTGQLGIVSNGWPFLQELVVDEIPYYHLGLWVSHTA
jgi:hypothetical protein